MTASIAELGQQRFGDFRHEALFYEGQDGLLEGAVPFVRDGVDAGKAILVVVDAAKIDRLRAELDGRADAVTFADMAEVGRNPARIIPVWKRFADEQSAGGRRMRGIGEPIWAERSSAELVECQQHESLLNLAFAQGPPLWLLCPYDTGALAGDVVDEARRSHPVLVQGDVRQGSDRYRGVPGPAAVFHAPLPEPGTTPRTLAFDAGSLAEARRFVTEQARTAGLEPSEVDSLVLAVNEVATNSLRHGGGGGTLRIWEEVDALVCEVMGGGSLGDPLVGRAAPSSEQEGGRGLWLVNQLCDLVQLRSFGTRTVARLHVARRGDPKA